MKHRSLRLRPAFVSSLALDMCTSTYLTEVGKIWMEVDFSLIQIVVYSEGQPTDDLAFGQQDELVRRSRRPVVEQR